MSSDAILLRKGEKITYENLSSRRSMNCDVLSSVSGGRYDVIDDECISDVPLIPSADRDDISTNQQLYWDMENLIFIYGEKSVQYEVFEHIDEIEVELHIPTDSQDGTAEVNTMHKSEPLIVKLHLSLSTYLSTPDRPKVEVFKQSKKSSFRVDCYQVRNFLEKFLSAEWHHLHQDYQSCLQSRKNVTVSNSVTTDDISELPSDEAVEKLVNLGFEADLARNALIITHGSISEAASLILDNPVKCAKQININKTLVDVKSDGMPPSTDSTVCAVPSKQASFPEVTNDENSCELGESDLHGDKSYKIQNDETEKENNGKQFKTDLKTESYHPESLHKLKMLLPTYSRMSIHDVNYTHDNLNVKRLSVLDGKNAKVVPSIADGFLVQIYRYVRQRIPTLKEYCVVCDDPKDLQSCSTNKPAVCSKPLCDFTFCILWIMADVVEEIETRPEVIDLLINLARAASKSCRRNLIFDPFPHVRDPERSYNLLLSPMKPDYHLAETLIEAIPSMNEMSLMESLEKKIDASNPLAFQLIQWIISSNRSHIVKLPSEKQLDFMQTPYQFLLRHSSPAKEAAFQEAKSKYGSSFAFHGSSIENWHSIIRQGLIKASGTRLQMHGAASGKGIYLSPEFTISMQYSRMGNRHFNENRTESDGQSQFLDSSDISCIALCEVINTPLKKCQSTWLCPVADNVRMRFLFVYQNEVGNLKVNTQDDRYLLPIYIALKHDEDIHKQTQ